MKHTIRKLALNAESLRVETFAMQEEPTAQPGTVHAHVEDTKPQTCGCPTRYTCNEFTCQNSCNCPSWSGPECGTVCVG